VFYKKYFYHYLAYQVIQGLQANFEWHILFKNTRAVTSEFFDLLTRTQSSKESTRGAGGFGLTPKRG
jgi:hypothetical protein